MFARNFVIDQVVNKPPWLTFTGTILRVAVPLPQLARSYTKRTTAPTITTQFSHFANRRKDASAPRTPFRFLRNLTTYLGRGLWPCLYMTINRTDPQRLSKKSMADHTQANVRRPCLAPHESNISSLPEPIPAPRSTPWSNRSRHFGNGRS